MFCTQSTSAVISGRAAIRTNNQDNETASILCHSLTVLNRDKIVYFFVHFYDGDPSVSLLLLLFLFVVVFWLFLLTYSVCVVYFVYVKSKTLCR